MSTYNKKIGTPEYTKLECKQRRVTPQNNQTTFFARMCIFLTVDNSIEQYR